jgi:predicted GIY-YIG superfamily endonuclease
MYLVYILKSDNLSYVGMTNDFTRRFRQHNGDLKGGAKYTKKRKFWYPICIIDGFETMKEAMQCEWRLKRGKGGPYGRINYLNDFIMNHETWTSKSPVIKTQNLIYYIDNDFNEIFIKNNNTIDLKELYWKE